MNSISKQILQSHQFFLKTLVGTLLVYSIIGIPFFVGYIARYLHQISEKKEFTLPQWNNWLALLIESWELLLTIFLYAIIPCSLLVLISSSVDQWFGPLWMLSWLPTMLMLFFAPILVCFAYYQYLLKGTFESLFDYKKIFEAFLSTAEIVIPLTLTLWGTLFIGFPVFGFTLAISIILYMPEITNAIETTRYR